MRSILPRGILISVALLLVTAQPAKAEVTTDWLTPYQIVNCTSAVSSSCTVLNLSSIDATRSATSTNSTGFLLDYRIDPYIIPEGATIKGIEHKEVARLQSGTTPSSRTWNINYGCSTGTAMDQFTAGGYILISTFQTWNIVRTPPWSVNSTITWDNDYCFRSSSGGASNYQVEIDYEAVKITWEKEAEITISDVKVSSNSAGFTFDVDGYVSTTGANIYCTINLYQQDTSGLYMQASPFASVDIYSDPDIAYDHTELLHDNVYSGYGYTPTSTYWQADDVRAPYYATNNMEIRMSYTCRDLDNNNEIVATGQSIDSASPNYVGSASIATPSALQNRITQEVCSNDDSFGDFFCKAKNWFISLWTPSRASISSVNVLKNEFNNKIPFGYINSITQVDWHTDDTNDKLTLIFPAMEDGLMVEEEIEITDPAVMTFFSAIRTFFYIVIVFF